MCLGGDTVQGYKQGVKEGIQRKDYIFTSHSGRVEMGPSGSITIK